MQKLCTYQQEYVTITKLHNRSKTLSFFTYIKAVATGPKSNRDLSYEEIKDAIQQILTHQCQSEQAAAFLMCLRVKLESNEELKGCLDSFDAYIKRVDIPQSIELGFSYDGKTDQPFYFL